MPTIASMTTHLTNSLVSNIIEDLAIEEHRLACRRRAEGSLYRTASGSVSSNGFLAAPRPLASGSGGPSPGKKDKDDATYDCLNCSRSIGGPRYAIHLSGCMGLGGAGGRRGEGRRAAAMASNGSGKPTNGSKSGLERAGSVSSYASDDDAMSGVEKKTIILKLPSSIPNNKRSASTPVSGGPKLKKHRPAAPPLVPGQISSQLAAPHLTSHLLTKTLSAPSTPSSTPIKPSHLSAPPASAPLIRKALAPSTGPVPVRVLPPPVHASDRPDSDSSADEDSADEQVRPAPPVRVIQATKAPKNFVRNAHPLARGADSDSATDSGSDGSGSD